MQFEPADYVPTCHLRDLLIEQMTKCLRDKDSFAYKPLANRDNLIPAPGMRQLLKHLKMREADRGFVLKWLSKLHTLGFEQPIFAPTFRFVKA